MVRKRQESSLTGCVDRTTNGSGAVADLTFADLRSLDAGLGEPVPSLDEVIDGTDVALQVEIKDPRAIGQLVDLLRRRPDTKARTTLTSFSADVVADVVAQLPECAAGLISGVGSVGLVDRASEIGARMVFLGWDGTNERVVDYAHAHGLAVGVWPVNTSGDLACAAALGVDAITTNYPALLQQAGYRISDGQLIAPP